MNALKNTRTWMVFMLTVLSMVLVGCNGNGKAVTVVIDPDATIEIRQGDSINLVVKISPGGQKSLSYKWSTTERDDTLLLSKTESSSATSFTANGVCGEVIVTVEVTADGELYPASRTINVICETPTVPIPEEDATSTVEPTATEAVVSLPADTPLPTETTAPTATPGPLECRHASITAYVFPQLKDVPGQRAFYGPLDESQKVFLCEGVREFYRSEPVSVRIEYHPVRDTGKFGFFGIGTLGGYDITRFKQICLWTYATQPDQVFRLKIRDTNEKEEGENVTVPDTNKWSQICVDLSVFANQGVNLSSLVNINLGFEEQNGDATIWVDDFEFK